MKQILNIAEMGVIYLKLVIIIKTLKGALIMAVARRTIISWGLVAIPVSLYTATQDNDIHFNQLHKEDDSRIKYKKTCAHCGQEINSDDIVKGFEYDKDKYVIVTDEELEKIKTEKEKSIQILHFAQLNQISPVYYEKTYQVIPEAGGEKAFELLRRSLMEAQKIAIGKVVWGASDTLMSIIPREDGMIIATMYYSDEIKELPKTYNKPEVTEQELKMATTLINTMDTPFDPSAYNNGYQTKVKELLENKINGKETVAPKEEVSNNVISLMEAFKQSIEQQKPIKGRKTQKKEKGA